MKINENPLTSTLLIIVIIQNCHSHSNYSNSIFTCLTILIYGALQVGRINNVMLRQEI